MRTARVRLPNERSVLRTYVRQLAKRGFTGKLVVESTGYYHWPLVQVAQQTFQRAAEQANPVDAVAGLGPASGVVPLGGRRQSRLRGEQSYPLPARSS